MAARISRPNWRLGTGDGKLDRAGDHAKRIPTPRFEFQHYQTLPYPTCWTFFFNPFSHQVGLEVPFDFAARWQKPLGVDHELRFFRRSLLGLPSR